MWQKDSLGDSLRISMASRGLSTFANSCSFVFMWRMLAGAGVWVKGENVTIGVRSRSPFDKLRMSG